MRLTALTSEAVATFTHKTNLIDRIGHVDRIDHIARGGDESSRQKITSGEPLAIVCDD